MTEYLGFPYILYDMLEHVSATEKSRIVSWQPHGRCFVVRRRRAFVQQVMPLFFRTTKFSSFQRQLNLYGFRRIKIGRDRGGYYHERFLRYRRDLCCTILRQQPNQRQERNYDEPESDPNFYMMEHMSERSSTEQAISSNNSATFYTAPNPFTPNSTPSAMTDLHPMAVSSLTSLFHPSLLSASNLSNAGYASQSGFANRNLDVWTDGQRLTMNYPNNLTSSTSSLLLMQSIHQQLPAGLVMDHFSSSMHSLGNTRLASAISNAGDAWQYLFANRNARDLWTPTSQAFDDQRRSTMHLYPNNLTSLASPMFLMQGIQLQLLPVGAGVDYSSSMYSLGSARHENAVAHLDPTTVFSETAAPPTSTGPTSQTVPTSSTSEPTTQVKPEEGDGVRP